MATETVLPDVPLDPVVTVRADDPVEALGLNRFLTNRLWQNGYETCDDVRALTWEALRDILHMGPKRVDDFRQVIQHIRVAPPGVETDVLHTWQDMRDERAPVGPKRYFLGDEEITAERYDELVADRARQIDAGRGGLL